MIHLIETPKNEVRMRSSSTSHPPKSTPTLTPPNSPLLSTNWNNFASMFFFLPRKQLLLYVSIRDYIYPHSAILLMNLFNLFWVHLSLCLSISDCGFFYHFCFGFSILEKWKLMPARYRSTSWGTEAFWMTIWKYDIFIDFIRSALMACTW